MARSYKNLIKGFDIVSPGDMYDRMINYAQKGALKGVYCGFPNINKHYTMSLPGVTDWTGFPRSGKTEIVLEFLVNTSMFYGWKHLIYLPDLGDKDDILSDIIHKYTGLSFDNRYEDNHIDAMTIAEVLPWATEHFKILTKEDMKAKITPYQFWDLAAEMKKDLDIQTATIDAWKDMKHDLSEFGREDKYLEDVLSYRNAMAEKHKMHFHTVVHPTRTDKDSAGDRKPPTPYDMKGGTEWYNNGKNMITAHRPSGEPRKVDIYFNKIKPRSIGDVGVTSLEFDRKKSRYFIMNGEEKLYAQKDEIKLITDQVSMNMDEDDDIPF